MYNITCSFAVAASVGITIANGCWLKKHIIFKKRGWDADGHCNRICSVYSFFSHYNWVARNFYFRATRTRRSAPIELKYHNYRRLQFIKFTFPFPISPRILKVIFPQRVCFVRSSFENPHVFG